MPQYNTDEIQKIEGKWQQFWEKNQTFKATENPAKTPYYILDMFPYPSGAGLHVGHPLGYIASDVVARYKRLKGFEVLHPMGYDAFGLPAEQFAIDTGNHPAGFTDKNIARYEQQLKMIGLSFDWSRKVKTSDPKFYKWTQWIFIQLFESWYNPETNRAEHINDLVREFETKGSKTHLNGMAGLDFTSDQWNNFDETAQQEILMSYRMAYIGESEVNWCPALGTVLANEEVKDGVSERGGYPVEKRKMRQWFLRITAYADRLLSDLNDIEWPQAVKDIQTNWIGKSVGAEVMFSLAGEAPLQIKIFTTRPDTIFGATFMVLAPEHEIVAKITTPTQKAEVEKYAAQAKLKTERERKAETKVSGVFTGAYAINPFTKKEIPIWIADYVLADYGTGAIMAVPGHDSRDWAFAKQFGLPIIEVVEGGNVEEASYDAKEGSLVNSDFLNGLEVDQAIKRAINEIELDGLGTKKVNYRLRDANFSRQRYWGEPFPIIYKNDLPYPVPFADLPVELPEVESYKPTGTGESPLASKEDWVNTPEGRRETNTMPGWAGSSWYFMRYMDPHNDSDFVDKEKEQYWKNVDFYIGGAEHATGHLLYARFWHKFLFDRGLVSTKEPFKRLINQGMIQGSAQKIYKLVHELGLETIFVGSSENSEFMESPLKNLLIWNTLDKIWSKNGYGVNISANQIFISSDIAEEYLIEIRKLDPMFSLLELYAPIALVEEQGNENSTFNYLRYCNEYAKNRIEEDYMFSVSFAFISKELSQDHQNYVFGVEKRTITKYSYPLSEDNPSIEFKTKTVSIEKMSKSKYNVINPDEVIEKYGCDAFRMYEMFLGPIEQSKPWDTKGIDGVSRFLKRFWALFYAKGIPSDDREGTWLVNEEKATPEELKILHKTIKKTEDDIERFNLNTCVSSYMIAVNELSSLNCHKREILEPLVILVSPFAPHIAEELWNKLGHKNSVSFASFPVYNESYTAENSFEYPVSINGKLRAKMELPLTMNKDQVEAEVKRLDLSKWTEGKPFKKIIVVHGKIVNVVV